MTDDLLVALAGIITVPVAHLNTNSTWSDVLHDEDSHEITEQTARLLGMQDGDKFFRITGDEMTGAGLPDGALVAMRFLRPGNAPRKGEAVLVEMCRNDEYQGIIRVWGGLDADGRPALTDGLGVPLDVPTDATHVVPVAVARGVMASI